MSITKAFNDFLEGTKQIETDIQNETDIADVTLVDMDEAQCVATIRSGDSDELVKVHCSDEGWLTERPDHWPTVLK